MLKSPGLRIRLGTVGNVLAKYYQWLSLGIEDDVVNKGTGGSPVDGLVISGTMAGQDLIIDWTRGDAGLIALATAYGIANPITYAQMKALLAYPQYEIVKDANTISKLKLPEQEVFGAVPILSGSDWIYKDQTVNNNNAVVKNTQYVALNGVDNYFRSKSKFTYLVDGFRHNIKFSFPSTPVFWSISGTRGGAPYAGEWMLKLTGTIVYFYYNDGVTKSVSIADTHVNDRIRNVEVIFIDGIFTMTLTDEVGTYKTVSSGVESITPAKSEIASFGNEYIDVNTIFTPISVYETTIENTITETLPYLDYKCEDSDGAILYDNSGRGNDAEMVGTLTNIWDNFKDNIQPHMLQNSYTIYQNDSTLAYLRRINSDIDNNLYISIASGQSNMKNFVYINQMDLIIAEYLPAEVGEDDIYEYEGTIFIDNSINGADIAYWDKDILGDGWVRWKNCVERVIAYAESIGKTPVFMSEIWMQGESDTDTAEEYNTYNSDWRALVANKRGVSSYLANLPIQDFLLSSGATGLDLTGKTAVNLAKTTVAGDTVGVEVINTDIYTFKPDNIHYNDNQASLQKDVWDATYTKPTYVYNSPETGYTRISEIPLNVFSNTGNEILGILYSDWELNNKTYAEIEAIPIIPKEYFRINNEGVVIKDMASLKQ